jgi:hypothetical protein
MASTDLSLSSSRSWKRRRHREITAQLLGATAVFGSERKERKGKKIKKSI